MKILIASLVLLMTSSAFARQYIQCSSLDVDYTDVIVVNLQTNEGGTLFMSSGMQNDESDSLLVKIKKGVVENGKVHYTIVDQNETGEVIIDAKDLGKAGTGFLIDLAFNSYRGTYSCFSSLYND